MRTRFAKAAVAAKALFATNAMCAGAFLCMTSLAAAQQPIVIRAGTLIDGKGSVQRNAVITIEGSKISRLGDRTEHTTYDFSRFTVLPGMIDTHVHIGEHFGKDGRAAHAASVP